MEENKYLIELSDYEYKVITEEELQEAKDSAEKFDGFLGFYVIGTINDIMKWKKTRNVVKNKCIHCGTEIEMICDNCRCRGVEAYEI